MENLEHRAGKDADGKTGDGVGILTQIPHDFFKKIMKKQGADLPDKREYAVGMIFFPQNDFDFICFGIKLVLVLSEFFGDLFVLG